MNGLLELTAMSTWRRIKSLTRYKLNFMLELFMGLIWGFGFLIFQYVVDPSVLQQVVGTTSYVSFLLIGAAFQAYYGVALWGSPNEIQNELTTGQIEYTFSSPVSRYAYMLSYVFSDAVVATLFQIVPMTGVALLFSPMSFSLSGVMWSVAVIILTFLVFCQIGVLFSCALLLFKNVSALGSFMNFLFQIATGMFVPLQFMPDAFKGLAFVIPLTEGMDLTRHFLIGSNTVWPVELEFGALLFFFTVFAVLARFAVSYVENRAKKEGLSVA